MTGALVRAELARLRGNRSIVVLPAVGAAFVALSTAGNASVQRDKVLAHTTTLASASYFLVGMGFAMVLFSALSGALLITSEHRSRSFGLMALVAPSRTPLLWAKSIVAAGAGMAQGVLGVIVAIVTARLSMGRYDLTIPLDGRTVGLAVGLVLLCGLAGAWGLFIGAAVRAQVAAFAGIVVWMTMIEAAVLHLFPSVGRWLPGGAQAAIVADPSLPQRLGRPSGGVLLLGWMLLAAVAAVHTLRTRDI
jgi:ABC-type transport system involved in multi-copper enzyme maturation permease subunit